MADVEYSLSRIVPFATAEPVPVCLMVPDVIANAIVPLMFVEVIVLRAGLKPQ
jgi:hypothetical protein